MKSRPPVLSSTSSVEYQGLPLLQVGPVVFVPARIGDIRRGRARRGDYALPAWYDGRRWITNFVDYAWIRRYATARGIDIDPG